MTEDDIRKAIGRAQAFEAVAAALIATHPDKPRLEAAFTQCAEALRTHLLNTPVPDGYLNGFDRAYQQLLDRMK